MIAAVLDSLLSRPPGAAPARDLAGPRHIDTRVGSLRVLDTGGPEPVVLMTPDGPNVIEHHAELIERLRPHARVVCFEMPGFGFSAPRTGYGHRLEQGAGTVLAVMDRLAIGRAALAFSCANGFYAIAAAKRAPQRVTHLVLAQTPGFSAMPAWTARNVPRPLRLPVAGQLLNRAARHKLVHAWYGIAMNEKPRRDAFRATARRALEQGACFCLAGLVQGLSRTRAADLRGVKTPATLVWGDADRSHPHTRAESLLELLPHARVRHEPGCGHFPDLERPDAYATLIKESL